MITLIQILAIVLLMTTALPGTGLIFSSIMKFILKTWLSLSGLQTKSLGGFNHQTAKTPAFN